MYKEYLLAHPLICAICMHRREEQNEKNNAKSGEWRGVLIPRTRDMHVGPRGRAYIFQIKICNLKFLHTRKLDEH